MTTTGGPSTATTTETTKYHPFRPTSLIHRHSRRSNHRHSLGPPLSSSFQIKAESYDDECDVLVLGSGGPAARFFILLLILN